MTIEAIHGAGALQEAQKKARYGHNDWLYWRDASGEHAARRSAEAIKAMLLAVGTRGKWFIVNANSGNLMRGFWWLGINILRQSRRGFI